MDEAITADYAFRMAERVEWNGQQFYILAAQAMAQPATRQGLLWLADREAEHRQTFAALRERLAQGAGGAPAAEVDLETTATIRTLLAGKFFDPAVRPDQYFSPDDTSREIILTAMGFEKETIVFYQALKSLVADADALKTLDTVLREEMSHLARLAATLD